MLTVFWDMKRPITIDFLEKGATVNSASYCQLKQYSPYLLNDSCIMDYSFFLFSFFFNQISYQTLKSAFNSYHLRKIISLE